MARKNVRFDYFETWIMEYDKETNNAIENKVDISDLLNKAMKMSHKEVTKDFRGEKARIQHIHCREDGLYEIQFLRLRETMPPGIANDEGDFEIIKLEDNEYIGEFTAALYDPINCYLVMHRNFQAFTPSGLQEYLTSSMKDVNKDIVLKPIFNKTDIEKILKADIYRSFNISIDSSNINALSKQPTLSKILNNAAKYDGSTLNISISVGHAKKNRTLDTKAIRALIDESEDNSDLNKFVIKYKEFEDSKIEEIDLLDHRMHDRYIFIIDRDKPLTYEVVISKLVELYNERKEK